MLKDSLIDEEMLKKVGIYELREMARRFGVPSPTTKKREELCKLILNTSLCDISTKTRKQKGRPPKSVSRVNAILSESFPEELIKLKDEFSIEDDFVYKKLSLAQSASYNYQINEENLITGFLRLFEDKYYMMQKTGLSAFITYVPKEFIEKYSLRIGDKITGIYSVSPNDSNCLILMAVKTINDLPPSKKELVNLDLVSFTNESLTFLNFELKKGSRNLISFENINEACEKIINFIDKDVSNTKFVIVGGEISPENYYFIKSRNKVDSFLSQFGDEAKDIYARVEDALNYSTSLLLEGRKVCLIILDVVNLINNLDLISNKDSVFFKDHNTNSVQMLKKLIALGRFINKDSYLTTCSIVFDSQKNNEIVCEFKNNLFNRIIE